MLGPIDYIVVGFKGNNFDGSIARELTKASKNGVIRVIDMLFIVKDANGDIAGGEFTDQSKELKEAFGELDFADDRPLLSEADMAKVGEAMENDTAAGVLVIEQLWAKGLKKALLDAGGEMIDEGRIHPDKVRDAMKDFKGAAA